MQPEFFPARPDSSPVVYAYRDSNPQYNGMLKVGYTTKNAAERVNEQYGSLIRPGPPPYKILVEESAMREDGTGFLDRDVHKALIANGVKKAKGEWFVATPDQVRAAIIDVRRRARSEDQRDLDFGMRPEQAQAVAKTADFIRAFKNEHPEKPAKFLWNAKMRFGKTFAAYQLARTMGWTKILVLTFKPAVRDAWEEDLKRHRDFEGWQFVTPGGLDYNSPEFDAKRPYVVFGSFQDYLGKNRSTGGIKTKNEWVHWTNWDCVILDEYHYGAWRENAKELFAAEDAKEQDYADGGGLDLYDEEEMPITTGAYLYLSGTPFRAIASGEFIEEEIFNWTYSDEQRAKQTWKGDKNPYAALPRMVLMTYQLPDSIAEIAKGGEFDEFDLNIFFSAQGTGESAKFLYENEVQKWLDMIRGSYLETSVDNMKMGAEKPPFPFSDARLLAILNHTLWFLPTVAACNAMANLLKAPQNKYFHDHEIVVAAGTSAGIGDQALPPVFAAMDDPLKTRTITLSCGKLMTGVTVRPWSGIFMLKNCNSPETYFQAAFRVQSPWTIKNPEGDDPNEEQILKEECYVFDFAPNRALRQIAEYSARLTFDEQSSPEKRVEEFISFLPVLAYDGSSMKQIDAAGILEMASSGTTATLLARRWESALLVNVDNDTLRRLMANQEAMDALMNIEGFRSLNQDIETIINKSEAVKKARKAKNDEEVSPKEKKQLSDDEKEFKSKRKMIQEKLIKFATRVPIFMYLTDFREQSLKDVITKLDPDLFKTVTGLSVRDFEMLVNLNVFNSGIMNDAVYKFKRYEDASLVYTGINKHPDTVVGLFDTVISMDDYTRPIRTRGRVIAAEEPAEYSANLAST